MRFPRPGWLLLAAVLAAAPGAGGAAVVERDLAVPMRDGVTLRADLYRPAAEGRFPVLVYRTPYGKGAAAESYATHLRAVERGYAVLLQDVRGRYASEGLFDPYRNEGRDGYDTIEWAAAQPWSNGRVGTWGLSYPGAVQWLAAVESPPHLHAMVPAMTFSTPANFFYSGGVFDGSWLEWILLSIAPDLRARGGLPGPRSRDEAVAEWTAHRERWQRSLPFGDFPELRRVAPFFFEWLRHPPDDPWWRWAEIRGRYDRVGAAVLNLSGWHDEAYGPEGAATNFSGLLAARAGQRDPRTRLVLGPWTHGVAAVGSSRVGDRDFGPAAAIDYDRLVLSWMDRHLRGIEPEGRPEAAVRTFVMGAGRWREDQAWPPPAAPLALYLAPGREGSAGGALAGAPVEGAAASSFVSDPDDPVTDPHPGFGAHDYASLARRGDLLVFDSEPLDRDLEVVGPIVAEIELSCDCADTDLWVKLLDVDTEGRAWNLMSPGLDVLRASYREPARGRQLLAPGEIYRLRLENLMTGNLFRRGHRIRVQISAAFFPRFSRNLHTGELETASSHRRRARITIHHDRAHPSRILLPVVGGAAGEPGEGGR